MSSSAVGHYAVIFTSQLSNAGPVSNSGLASVPSASEVSTLDYEVTSERMISIAREQKGFLGVDSVRDVSGLGITVSYWATLEDIAAWRKNSEHLDAQSRGRNEWYSSYSTSVCLIERAYSHSR